MKVLPVVFLTVAVFVPNVAEAQSPVYSGQSSPGYTIMAGPSGQRLPVFYDPTTGEWRTPLYDCTPDMLKSRQVPMAAVGALDQPPATRIHLSPGRRYTILNQQGNILAFNEETGELFIFVAGGKRGSWERLSDSIPTMHTGSTPPEPTPRPGPAPDG